MKVQQFSFSSRLGHISLFLSSSLSSESFLTQTVYLEGEEKVIVIDGKNAIIFFTLLYVSPEPQEGKSSRAFISQLINNVFIWENCLVSVEPNQPTISIPYKQQHKKKSSKMISFRWIMTIFENLLRTWSLGSYDDDDYNDDTYSLSFAWISPFSLCLLQVQVKSSHPISLS